MVFPLFGIYFNPSKILIKLAKNDAPDKSFFRRLYLTLKISQFAEHAAKFGSSQLLCRFWETFATSKTQN